MLIKLPTPGRYSEDDLAFVSECLKRYFEHLPREARLGFRRPISKVGESSPFAVPPDMIDGPGPSPELVVWKPVPDNPPRGIDPTLPEASAPLTFIALMRQWRWCSLRLFYRGTEVVMPPTPKHRYNMNLYRYQLRWGGLAHQCKYVPFADDASGRELICFDRTVIGPDKDSPIVAIPTEPLCRMGFVYPREVVEKLARPVAPSFREFLAEACSKASVDEIAKTARPPARVSVASTSWQPFDWEPLLMPELDAQAEGPVLPDIEDVAEIDRHVNRITEKIAIIRQADPAFLIPGSPYHRWQPWPAWLPEQRAAFEEEQGIKLPEPYARFLMIVGNGGIAPRRWQYQAENSRPDYYAETARWEEEDEDHFAEPFPHRTAWVPPPPKSGTEEMFDYDDPRHVRGTMLLGHWRGGSRMSRALMLVIDGPERGHVWVDDRYRTEGIWPLYRRGPWSFLAWYEQALDHILANLDRLYYDIEHKPIDEYYAVNSAAWRLPQVPAGEL